MKALRFIYKTLTGLSVGLVLLALTACRPEEEKRPRPHVPEGEDAVVSLKWTMPAMEENKFQLCSPVSEERARRLEDLWVGIYNVKTGECTANFLLDMTSDAKEHTAQKIQNIKTKSGESYIVAAANVRKGYGVSELMLESGDTVRLSKLLQQADTWKKYKSISAVLPQPNGIRVDGSFVMAGSFLAGGMNDLPAGTWSDANGNPATVTIGTGKTEDLGGYIHLRRLFAYNRVTIAAGQHIKMELQNWQVCNLPVMSYLQERKSENAADVSIYFENGKLTDYQGNYSHTPVAHVFEAGAKAGEYVFDFYQFENRHAGLKKSGDVGVAEYQDRDREWKDGSSGYNTGVYKSLCATPAEPKPGPAGQGVNTNNYATYIVIKANIAYYAEDASVEAKPVAHPDSTKPAGAVLRTGNVSYVVHLGYCEGPKDKVGEDSLARDFNVRRNNWYDYKVTINGLKNIGLEATSGTTENERQPGAEGYVFDSKEVIELDAHYGVFNISMTNWQRTNLQWVLDVPYGDDRYQETYLDYQSGETPQLRQNQFYHWIRFKPAPSKDLLAVYREKGLGDVEADAALWTLEDLRDVPNHPGIDGNGVAETAPDPEDASTVRWYTVFVNEYAYEDGPDETGTYNWKRYANKPDRVAYLNTKLAESPDGESRYMTPDYTIIQHSIQTYYNVQVTPTAALGVERECENYGLNLRWSDAVKAPAGGWNSDNGRWNEWQYAGGRDWYGANGILTDPTVVNGHPYLQAAETPAITRQYENKPAGKYAVYRLNKLSGNVAGSLTAYDPSDASYGFYEIMDACLNRNRDENGNGTLDKEELKWYLATSGKYLRIVLGRESLKAPLMQFGLPLEGSPGDGDASRHHYAASDYQMIWAEEGVSTSDMSRNLPSAEKPYPWPWQVRCVRNMGVNFSEVLANDPVPPAYRVDQANHRILFDYYDDASLRPSQTGTMAVHKVDDLRNRASRILEYAIEDCKNMSTNSVRNAWGTSSDGTLVIYRWRGRPYYSYGDDPATAADLATHWEASVAANEFCGRYTQYGDQSDLGTWRVPNQVELTVMLRLNIFNTSGVHWLSCTEEYYKNSAGSRRFISVRSDDGGQVTLGGGAPFRIRCVRDVD